jgi:flagellar motor switch/type III secretory pathway protein FliN
VTEHVREWLPKEAFTREVVRPALSELLSAWSQRWFVHARADVGSVRGGEPRVVQSPVIAGDCAEIELSGRGKRNLLEALTGVELAGLTLNEADHRVLDAFAGDALADLLAAIDDKVAGKGNDGALVIVSLVLGGKEMCSLFLPEHVLIPAMKGAMARRREAVGRPRGCLEALRPVRLSIEAVVGKAELSLHDLQHLSVGDVVVLDAPLKDGISLRLAGSGRAIGRGKLGRAGAHPTVQL